MTRELSTRQEFTSCPIPHHLRNLPVEGRGFPVPHVADWSDESAEANERRGDQRFAHLDLRHLGCPYPDVVTLDPKGTQGKGAPRIAKQNPVRSRECIEHRICSICGRKASPEETLAFIGARRPDGHMLLTEPGMHKRCAAFVVFACPGINNEPGLIVVESRTYEIVPECFYVQVVDGEERHIPARLGTWVPFPDGYLLGFRVMPPDDAPSWPLAEWREANEHLLDNSGKRKPKRRRVATS
jgi:hypothetical protein